MIDPNDRSMQMLKKFYTEVEPEIEIFKGKPRRPRHIHLIEKLEVAESWRRELQKDLSRKISKIMDCNFT